MSTSLSIHRVVGLKANAVTNAGTSYWVSLEAETESGETIEITFFTNTDKRPTPRSIAFARAIAEAVNTANAQFNTEGA